MEQKIRLTTETQRAQRKDLRNYLNSNEKTGLSLFRTPGFYLFKLCDLCASVVSFSCAFRDRWFPDELGHYAGGELDLELGRLKC